MNRFSKDIGYIDDLIPQTVSDFMIVTIQKINMKKILINYYFYKGFDDGFGFDFDFLDS